MGGVVRIAGTTLDSKKIGLIAPHQGRIMEEEYPQVTPPDITYLIDSLNITNLNPDNVDLVLENVEVKAKLLAEYGSQLIIQCGTPLVFTKGYGFDKVLIERIQNCTGLPASTMTSSVVEALQFLKAEKVCVVTPYIDELNQRLISFLKHYDIEVLVIKRVFDEDMQIVDNYNAQPITRSLELARLAVKEAPSADAIFISCGGFRTLENIELLEKETGKPVISSNSSTIWKSLRMLGEKLSIEGYGTLLTQIDH